MCNHDWRVIGGTACNYRQDDTYCSRLVQKCVFCGDCDYGESIIADDDCASCPNRVTSFEFRKRKEEDAYNWFLKNVKNSKKGKE